MLECSAISNLVLSQLKEKREDLVNFSLTQSDWLN